MANTKVYVGKRVNLDLLTKEVDKNNHKLKVSDFMNLFYLVMTELEEHHPVIKETMEKLGDENYNAYICSVVFALCLRLSASTLSQEAFEKMIDRISSGEVEIEKEPTDQKELN